MDRAHPKSLAVVRRVDAKGVLPQTGPGLTRPFSVFTDTISVITDFESIIAVGGRYDPT